MFRTFSTFAILALTAAAAQAEDVAIKYGDLNLSSPAGAHVFAERVHTASETVCASQKPDASTNTFYRSIYDTCVLLTSHAISEKVGMAPTVSAKLANN